MAPGNITPEFSSVGASAKLASGCASPEMSPDGVASAAMASSCVSSEMPADGVSSVMASGSVSPGMPADRVSSAMASGGASPEIPQGGLPSKVTVGDASRGRQQLATMKLNDSKAGMEGLDTDRINQIIEEASRGSKFYNHKKQRQEKIDERIRRMLELKDSLTPAQIAKAEAQMDALAAQLERSRDLSRFIVHVDMDAFYAAVEMRDRPELRDVPMAVGGMGMLSTSNYAARKFGVRAAMPGFIGRKLCPQLVIIPCNFDKYRAASNIVQGVLARYDPAFSMMSLDEGYLDITEKVAAVMSEADGEAEQSEEQVAQQLVCQLRAEIHQETQLTASAGIACNGMLAKICSDRNKPNGQFFLRRERHAVLEFLRDLPVRKVCGIGNVMSQHLAALDITCCGHLLQQRALLRLLFSDIAQESLLRAGLGVRDATSSRDDEERHQKSVSTETTFAATADAGWLLDLLRQLCAQLADDLRSKRLRGRTVTFKVKTSSFVVRSRATALAEPTAAAETLLGATRPALVRELASGEPLRLLGVRASALVSAEEAAGRRQATLAEMAGRGAVVSARHCCPVCGRDAASLAELSAHVDRCLAGEADDADRPEHASTGVDRETDQGGDSVVAEGVPQSGTSGDLTTSRPAVSSACGTHSDASVGEDRAASRQPLPGDPAGDGRQEEVGQELAIATTKAVDTVVGAAVNGTASQVPPAVCPVCAGPLPSELLLVNRHLDECLNQQLLSQLTDGAPVSGLKRPLASQCAGPSAKLKRIDAFFQVKK